MTPANEQDPVMDRLLARTMSERRPDSACLDAETLAAWAEGGLAPASAATVEAHVSNCSRCQALVTVFVRGEPEPAPVVSLWEKWRLKWLVPALGAAAAVTLYIATQPNLARPPERALEPAVQISQTPSVAPSTTLEQESLSAPPSAAASAQRRDAPARQPERETDANAKAAADASTSAQPFAAATAAPVALSRESPLPVFFAGAGQERWRMRADAFVEWSMDGGMSWQQVSQVSMGIRAGASPSSRVAWLVGVGGAVWVTVTTQQFVRLPFPEQIDLISVTAIDARSATVTTADQRRFTTSDQAASWTLVAGSGQ